MTLIFEAVYTRYCISEHDEAQSLPQAQQL